LNRPMELADRIRKTNQETNGMEVNEIANNMETIVGSLVQMGALGIMLAYMMFKENKTTMSHQAERSEWHAVSQKRNDEIGKVIDKNTAAFTEHQQTMARLCEKIDNNQCRA